MIFVDTNYFLRFLLADIDDQHKKAKALFQKGAEGKIDLTTSLIVFFEIYWVLSTFYNRQKDELVEKLEEILSMTFVKFQERESLAAAVRIFAKTALDLEDAYNLVYASAQGVDELKTFDKRLEKIFGG